MRYKICQNGAGHLVGYQKTGDLGGNWWIPLSHQALVFPHDDLQRKMCILFVLNGKMLWDRRLPTALCRSKGLHPLSTNTDQSAAYSPPLLFCPTVAVVLVHLLTSVSQH